MTAPALVLLASGFSQPPASDTLHALRKRMQMNRPELNIGLAFVGGPQPSAQQVVSVLIQRGVTEVVFVPLDLTRAVEVDEDSLEMLAQVRKNHPSIGFAMARPLGPATDLLNVLDTTLRDALRAAHCVEIDSLVLSVPRGGDIRGNALLSRRARQWSAHHKLPVVVASADGSGLSMAQAIASLRSQGRRHIAVGSLWLARDETFASQANLAIAAGAKAVSAPMGDHSLILDLVMNRYAFAAMDLLDDAALGIQPADLEAAASN